MCNAGHDLPTGMIHDCSKLGNGTTTKQADRLSVARDRINRRSGREISRIIRKLNTGNMALLWQRIRCWQAGGQASVAARLLRQDRMR